jgi:dTDP-glucose 4,6-dehydratase
MRREIRKILVTGGAGFIGSAFVRLLLKSQPSRRELSIIVIDKLTYAADLARLNDVKDKYKLYKVDICNKSKINAIFKKEKPIIVVNFAAETHVDRSIKDAAAFIDTNVKGTQILLDASRKYKIGRFIHISTDEVYGEIKKDEFSEDSPLQANSPYAASKAAADLLIKAYIRTYKFPAIIIRPCNNYGPWQYPEKFIPLSILKILRNDKIPVYGRGVNVREWLYVEDCARGILKIVNKGSIGEIYNIGSNQDKHNIEIAHTLLKILKVNKGMIQFVKDRPGHDLRYKLNSRKVFQETTWRPKVKLEEGLRITVNWCLKNKDWLLSKWIKIAPLYK